MNKVSNNSPMIVKNVPEMRPIPGRKPYMAGIDGCIYRKKSNGNWVRQAPSITSSGYYSVLSGTERVHRLVAKAFLGAPRGRVVNHKDFNRFNNKPENLEYCSNSANSQHAWDNHRYGAEDNDVMRGMSDDVIDAVLLEE